MKARYIFLILLAFCASTGAKAQEVKKVEALTSGKPYYDLKKDSLDHWERTRHIRNNMDHLQTFPVVNRPSMQLDVGPAQFRLTIPFR